MNQEHSGQAGQGIHQVKVQPEQVLGNSIRIFILQFALAMGSIAYYIMHFRHISFCVLIWAHTNLLALVLYLLGLSWQDQYGAMLEGYMSESFHSLLTQDDTYNTARSNDSDWWTSPTLNPRPTLTFLKSLLESKKIFEQSFTLNPGKS